MEWFLLWLVCGFGAAFVAASKNRGGGRWFLLGLLLGPIALLIVGLSATLPATERAVASRGQRLCPFCAEEIKPEAVVCKHCGREVPPPPPDEAARQFRCLRCGHMTTTETGKCRTCGADL